MLITPKFWVQREVFYVRIPTHLLLGTEINSANDCTDLLYQSMPGWKFDLNRPKGQNVAVYENIPGPISLDTNFNLVSSVASIITFISTF